MHFRREIREIVQVAEEVRRLHHDARHGLVDRRRNILDARRRRRKRHDLVARHPGNGLDGLAIVRMQVAGENGLVATRLPVRHQHGLRRRRRAVVHGGVGDLHAGQHRDLRLELVEILQRALRDFRLIGRVGGQELRALDQVIDSGRHVVLVGARANEERN